MRKLFSGLLLGAALTFAGSAAGALPYTGTLFLALGTLPPVAINGSGTGDPSLPSISANSFIGSGSSPVTGVAPITQIFLGVTGNATGTVASGPTITATLQARGFGLGIPLVGAPLGGKVGFESAFLSPVHSGGSGSVSAHFGPWTTGVASVIRTLTLGGGACVAATCPTGMLGGATANANFFGGAAQIVLVSPTDLYTTTGAIGGIPTFTIMALNYVGDPIPEPGTLLLLGSGVVGLALVGRKRLS